MASVNTGSTKANLIIFILLLAAVSTSLFSPIRAQSVSYTSHAPILIKSNGDFTAANGVTSGSGTAADPYAIQGWDINASGVNGITVLSTTTYFVIRQVNVHQGIRGIFLNDTRGGTVSNSVLAKNNLGAIIDYSPSFTISGSAIYSGGQGVTVDFSMGVNIIGNNVSSNVFEDIWVNNSPSTNISGNTISGHEGYGIRIQNSPNVQVSDNTIFSRPILDNILLGIFTGGNQGSDNTVITRNRILNSFGGGIIISSNHAIVSNNNITSSRLFLGAYQISGSAGLAIAGSYTSVKQNIFTSAGIIILEANRLAFSLEASVWASYPPSAFSLFDSQTITPDNLVNGKPALYSKDCNNLNLDRPSAGQIIVANCTGVRIADFRVNGTSVGVEMAFVKGGLMIHDNFTGNSFGGVLVEHSQYVTVATSNFDRNTRGLVLSNVTGFLVTADAFIGYPFVGSPPLRPYASGLSISGDTLNPSSPSSGKLYHNSFTNITSDIGADNTSLVSFDNGYPSGGNYYWDFSATDNCSGPLQNICPDADGISDLPSGLDHYPLMRPYAPPPDSAPPTWPSNANLTASHPTTRSVMLNWTPASDKVDVIAYRIYAGNQLIAYMPGTVRSYNVTGLAAGVSYTFKVEAGNTADNWSTTGPSTVAVTTTLPGTISITWILIIIAIVVVSVGGALLVWRFYRKTRIPRSSQTGAMPPVSQLMVFNRRLDLSEFYSFSTMTFIGIFFSQIAT